MLIKTYVIRLGPGNDLKKELQQFVDANNIEAGWVVTCVGSLTEFNIRFANKQEGIINKGYFEIVSLGGTLSKNGSHLHIAVSDEKGNTIGGHILEGNIIYTTAEIVIQASGHMIFTREKDNATSWKELRVTPK